jgi:hypothetical protein
MNFIGRLRGLLIGVMVGVVAALSSPVAYAGGYVSSEGAAEAACQASIAAFNAQNPGSYQCAADPSQGPDTLSSQTMNTYYNTWQDVDTWSYPASGPPVNPCMAIPSVPSTYLRGKYLVGFSAPEMSPASAGPQISCAISFIPLSPPILDPNSGQWYTFVSATPSGNPAGGTGVTDGNGDTPSPEPPIPTMPMVTVTATPQVCGGGSCYDAASNQFAAVDSDGNQIILPGPTADSSAGGCTSGANSSICGGSPNAPLPPAPPNSPISSPPTQVQNVDTFTQANPTTGANQTVTIATYSASPGGTTSGQGPGDSGPPKTAPASGSSSGTGTYGSGVNCGTPPACTGDVPTCGVVQQVWFTRCGATLEDPDATGQPDWTKPNPANETAWAVTPAQNSDVFTSNTTGTSGLDSAGWHGNTCPILPTVDTGFGVYQIGDQESFCNWLAAIRACVLVFGAYLAVRILGGSKA